MVNRFDTVAQMLIIRMGLPKDRFARCQTWLELCYCMQQRTGKNGVDSSLWPMAVTYAVYVYNNTPNAQNLCPADLFTGSTVPRHRLRDLHTWGCPVYVLDPSLQAGKKLPRWEPRSRRGVFVGLSTIHSSEVPLILNLTTGSITPQYHVVFDDRYSTVASIGDDDDPPSDWDDLCLDNSLYVPADAAPDTPQHLHDDWLTEAEREVKHRDLQRQDRVRNLQHPQIPTPSVPSVSSPTLPPPSTSSSEGEVQAVAPTTSVRRDVRSSLQLSSPRRVRLHPNQNWFLPPRFLLLASAPALSWVPMWSHPNHLYMIQVSDALLE
jgi:hypothetical protein